MSRWNYEPDAVYPNDYCRIKKGLFGKKLVSMGMKNNPIQMPRGSKVKVKIENDNIALYINNKLFNETQFDHFWFDEKKPNILYAKRGADDKIIMIDCLTGKHTPIAETIRNQGVNEPYLVDANGHILKINDDLTTTDTGLVRINESVGKLMSADNMVAKNANGKYVLLNPKTLELLIDKEFDNENIELALHIEGKYVNEPNLKVFSDEKDFYFLGKNDNLLGIFKADSISHFRSEEETIKTVRLYDKEKNITILIKLNTESNEIVETKQFNNLVCDYYIKDGKTYYITSDENRKMGVVDENDKQIIPNKYDTLEIKLMDSKESNNETINKESEKILWVEENDKKGIFSLDGKELLPCEYKEVVLEQSIKFNDTYRFFAQNKDDAFGVMNSKGEVEMDFNYKLANKSVFVRSVSKDNESDDYKNYHNGIVLAPIPPKFEGFVEGFEPDYKPENSIYIRDMEKCSLSIDNAETKKQWTRVNPSISRVGNYDNESQGMEVSSHSSLEVFMYGSILGNLFDNPSYGQVMAMGIMGSDTESYESDDCESSDMDY